MFPVSLNFHFNGVFYTKQSLWLDKAIINY